MKKITLLFITGFIMIININARNISYETSYFKMEIDEKGYIVSIYDKLKNTEYLPGAQNAPLLSIRCNGEIEQPSLLKQKNNKLILLFGKNKVEAQINTVVKPDYISF